MKFLNQAVEVVNDLTLNKTVDTVSITHVIHHWIHCTATLRRDCIFVF